MMKKMMATTMGCAESCFLRPCGRASRRQVGADGSRRQRQPYSSWRWLAGSPTTSSPRPAGAVPASGSAREGTLSGKRGGWRPGGAAAPGSHSSSLPPAVRPLAHRPEAARLLLAALLVEALALRCCHALGGHLRQQSAVGLARAPGSGSGSGRSRGRCAGRSPWLLLAAGGRRGCLLGERQGDRRCYSARRARRRIYGPPVPKVNGAAPLSKTFSLPARQVEGCD